MAKKYQQIVSDKMAEFCSPLRRAQEEYNSAISARADWVVKSSIAISNVNAYSELADKWSSAVRALRGLGK